MGTPGVRTVGARVKHRPAPGLHRPIRPPKSCQLRPHLMQLTNGANHGKRSVVPGNPRFPGRRIVGGHAPKECSAGPPGAERRSFRVMAAPVLTPDLNELRGFCMAADLGSLGRAAVRLHVSQPSLSKRLASLEAKVGARLLERSPRGVVLTPAGRRLYTQARTLLEEADQVAEVMLGIRHTGAVIRLAASHSATEAFVAALLTNLENGRPLSVELVTANSQVVRALVADGRADLGVAASRPDHTPNPG